MHHVLAGAAGDFKHGAAWRQYAFQDVEYRILVARAGRGNLLIGIVLFHGANFAILHGLRQAKP